MKFFAFVGEALRPQEDPDGTKRPSIYEQALRKDLGLPPAVAPVAFSLPQDKLDAIKAYQSASNPERRGGGAGARRHRGCSSTRSPASSRPGSTTAASTRRAGSQQLAHSLLDVFASNYARLRLPRLFLLLQFVALLEDVTSTYGDERLEPLPARRRRSGRSSASSSSPARRSRRSTRATTPTALVTDFAVRVGAVAIAWFDKDNDVGENDIEMRARHPDRLGRLRRSTWTRRGCRRRRRRSRSG